MRVCANLLMNLCAKVPKYKNLQYSMEVLDNNMKLKKEITTAAQGIFK